MTNYGKAAVIATELLTDKKFKSPRDAWDKAIRKATASIESQKKVCPRNAYLGLCEAGLVKGVKPDKHANTSANGEYAIAIVSALKADPELANGTKKELWKQIAPDVRENGQVGVVLALWENKLIA